MDIDVLPTKATYFREHWGEDPVLYNDERRLVIKIYKFERKNPVFQDGERQIIDKIAAREDFFKEVFLPISQLSDLEKYISLDNFTLRKELVDFSKLQNCRKGYLSLSDVVPANYNSDDVCILDRTRYELYLNNLDKTKRIKQKALAIVKDKFSIEKSDEVNTSAIFANLGYIVRGLEG